MYPLEQRNKNEAKVQADGGAGSRPVYMATGKYCSRRPGTSVRPDGAGGISVPGAPVQTGPPYLLLLWILTISRYDLTWLASAPLWPSLWT